MGKVASDGVAEDIHIEEGWWPNHLFVSNVSTDGTFTGKVGRVVRRIVVLLHFTKEAIAPLSMASRAAG